MNALIILHDPMNGPGSLLPALQEAGVETWIANLFEGGDGLPRDPSAYDLYFLMGGEMSVNDRAGHPFLEAEEMFVKQAVESGAPVIGVCLGAQIIAKALGGAVHHAAIPERGFSEITLTEDGRRDPAFAGLPATFPVFQWHEETFELPPGSQLLARSFVSPRQAFRLNNAVGLQFHPEVDEPVLAAWFGNSRDRGLHSHLLEKLGPGFLADSRRLWDNLIGAADPAEKRKRDAGLF